MDDGDLTPKRLCFPGLNLADKVPADIVEPLGVRPSSPGFEALEGVLSEVPYATLISFQHQRVRLTLRDGDKGYVFSRPLRVSASPGPMLG